MLTPAEHRLRARVELWLWIWTRVLWTVVITVAVIAYIAALAQGRPPPELLPRLPDVPELGAPPLDSPRDCPEAVGFTDGDEGTGRDGGPRVS